MRNVFALLTLLAFSASPSGAQDPLALGQGIKAYWDADYDTAVTLLEVLDGPKLSQPAQILRHKFLGLSLFAKGDKRASLAELSKLLELEPGHELDPRDFPPPLLELFDEAKAGAAEKTYQAGLLEYRARNLEAAIAKFELAVRLDPPHPAAAEMLRLVRRDLEDLRDQCFPKLSWGELDAKKATCQGVDYSSSFKLPAPVNRITLIYSKHHFGLGTCWKIVLQDEEGNEVLVLNDPAGTFKDKQTPTNGSRWRVVELPEVRMIGRIIMYGEGGHDMERFLALRVGDSREDQLILGLEVICPVGP